MITKTTNKSKLAQYIKAHMLRDMADMCDNKEESGRTRMKKTHTHRHRHI